MMRDIFRRGVRMIQRFGSLEGTSEPWRSNNTWQEDWPKRVNRLSEHGRSMEIQQHGEHFYAPERSPVVKPAGGHASLNGPEPDIPQILAMPIPVGTKRRHGPLKTDK